MVKRLIFTALMLFSSTALASGFANLEDDQAIRANNGDVVVRVDTEGYHELLLDGEPVELNVVSYGDYVAYIISNVDRGTHKLTLVTDDGEETITVHVLRVHR